MTMRKKRKSLFEVENYIEYTLVSTHSLFCLNVQNKSGQIILFLEISNFKTCQSTTETNYFTFCLPLWEMCSINLIRCVSLKNVLKLKNSNVGILLNSI